VLRAFGLTAEDFVVRLSDRQFWTDFMNAKAVPEDQRYAFIQAIDKSEREPREKTAEKLGPLADEVFAILADAHSTKSDRLDTIEAGLRHRGLQDFVKRDYTVVRGLAYYTGVVFEVFDRSGEFRAIAGGGRYDTLLKNLGGVDLPALGFGIGDVVLGEILKGKNSAVAPKPSIDLYVGIIETAYSNDPEIYHFIQDCRDRGLHVDYSLKPGNWKRQVEAAESKNARFFCPINELFMEKKVQVRKMAIGTNLDPMTLSELLAFLEKNRRPN
jgi:histidyl-tRNA synthetase